MCVTITWVLFTSQMLDGKYLQSLIIYLTFFFFLSSSENAYYAGLKSGIQSWQLPEVYS